MSPEHEFMREKPSQGYLEWALSRFGAEWVEANLQVNSSETEITTTSSVPQAQVVSDVKGEAVTSPSKSAFERSVMPPPSGTTSPREKKMTVIKAKKPLRLLTDYHSRQMPSLN